MPHACKKYLGSGIAYRALRDLSKFPQHEHCDTLSPFPHAISSATAYRTTSRAQTVVIQFENGAPISFPVLLLVTRASASTTLLLQNQNTLICVRRTPQDIQIYFSPNNIPNIKISYMKPQHQTPTQPQGLLTDYSTRQTDLVLAIHNQKEYSYLTLPQRLENNAAARRGVLTIPSPPRFLNAPRKRSHCGWASLLANAKSNMHR